MTQHRILSRWVLVPIVVAGCYSPPKTVPRTTNPDMLAILLPSRIEIVEPFTQVGSVDEKGKPDWIELWLQAENALDSPGLMIAGKLLVELYEFIPASGYSKGRRLDHWNIDLVTIEDQRNYWNAVTQMYEFRLGLNPQRIRGADKYVLAVTYYPPGGDRLMDEMVIARDESAASR